MTSLSCITPFSDGVDERRKAECELERGPTREEALYQNRLGTMEVQNVEFFYDSCVWDWTDDKKYTMTCMCMCSNEKNRC